MKAKVPTTQLPEDFVLTEKRRHRALAFWKLHNVTNLDADVQFHLFTSHWWTKGEEKHNWDMAWNTWYGKALGYSKEQRNNARKGSGLRHVVAKTRKINGEKAVGIAPSLAYLDRIARGVE